MKNGRLSCRTDAGLHSDVEPSLEGPRPVSESKGAAGNHAVPPGQLELFHPWPRRHLQGGRGGHRERLEGAEAGGLCGSPPAAGRAWAEAAVRDVVQKFGYERTFFVLAATVQNHEHDGRYSRSNKDWARTVPIFDSKRSIEYAVNSHPVPLILLGSPLCCLQTKR